MTKRREDMSEGTGRHDDDNRSETTWTMTSGIRGPPRCSVCKKKKRGSKAEPSS